MGTNSTSIVKAHEHLFRTNTEIEERMGFSPWL